MGNKITKLKNEDIKKIYTIGKQLGTGAFSTVKLATRIKDKKRFAVKIIKKTKLAPDELAVVHDEVEIMSRITHPHCVALEEMYENKKRLYLVLELLEGGELFDVIVEKGHFSEAEAASVMRQVTHAIKYLHKIGIVHRDLKPENLLCDKKGDDFNVKITDFGLAKLRDSNGTAAMSTACGTPGYVAPEVLRSNSYDASVDMWSLGVILYILLCGFPPFYHEQTPMLYEQIKKADYDFPDPYWTNISSEAKDLVTKLLELDVKKRYTPDQVLAHPWIAGKASDQNLGDAYQKNMAIRNARERMRQGIKLLLALNRFASIVEDDVAASESAAASS
jgi:calcium/calmodulin-dependent protein kinase I